jgi:hypothetical protein
MMSLGDFWSVPISAQEQGQTHQAKRKPVEQPLVPRPLDIARSQYRLALLLDGPIQALVQLLCKGFVDHHHIGFPRQ